jgi:RimJ/RimL family protein N-acetyltransferase
MDGQVTLRPVIEDDLSWLASLESGLAATGPHEWHSWSDPHRERRRWAIGIGLAPEFRGRGYGSAAQRLLVRYLFAHTQVNRVEATTEITNIGEQRALEKAGFTREGILRGTTFRQGRWHDQVMYSVLRDEVKLDDLGSQDGTA